MIIAKQKKKENIVEYILYMWQIEDMIRSFSLDLPSIEKKIINQFKFETDIEKQEMLSWYEGLIAQMKEEKIVKKGHLQFLKNTINDLYDLHLYMIKKKNAQYLQFYSWAKTHLEKLQELSKNSTENEIEAGLNGLYGYLMLKLQKREVSKETQESIQAISQMMAQLSNTYLKIETGEMELK